MEFSLFPFLYVCVFQLEGKVQQGERDFEQISKTIRKEVSRFEVRGWMWIWIGELLNDEMRWANKYTFYVIF